MQIEGVLQLFIEKPRESRRSKSIVISVMACFEGRFLPSM
jgi:hypothetical protein